MEYLRLRSGGKMPIVGYGTYLATGLDLEIALNEALEAGYRSIDTSGGYGNERSIGKVLNEWISSGKVTRDELFVNTSLPVYGNRAEDVEKYIRESLKKLQLDYIDMYSIHTPFGVFQGDTFDYTKMQRDDSTDPLKIWKVMEDQVDKGLTRAIGLSNFNVRQIQKILDHCRIRPDNVQNEIHLYLQTPELVRFCRENEITVTGYSSLGMKDCRKLLGLSWTNKNLPEMLENDVVVKVANKHRKTPAQVLLRFFIQNDVAVIPKSTNPQRLAENIRIFDFKLDLEDMRALRGQDAGEGGRIVRFLFFPGITEHPEYPFPIQF